MAVQSKEAGDLKKAQELLTGLSSYLPKSTAILAVLGDVHWDLGEFKQAAHCFRKGCELSPYDETLSLAYFHMLLKMKETDTALAEARRFLTHTDSADYRKIIADLHKQSGA